MISPVTNLSNGISIEKIPSGWDVHIARLHGNNQSYGSDWCASMIMLLRGDECKMIGGISIEEKISKQHSDIVVQYLKSKGIKKILYSKIKNGELHAHKIRI